ncbi:MAG: helix-turn-helix domain-containing protein, partial [Stackebrandtia sp.]
MDNAASLGGLIRSLRRSRDWTQTEVAHRIGCAVSLVSQVESGSRALRPWLAEAFDTVYRTGGTLALLSSTGAGSDDGEVIVVSLPGNAESVLLSRRAFLTAVGVGTVSGLPGLAAAVDGLSPSGELVADLRDAFAGLRTAARSLPPGRLIPALMGQVAVIDAVRHHAAGSVAQDLGRLQTRLAETLSWMCEENGNASAALYWIDRTDEWSRRSDWAAMQHYTRVRRSMLALSSAGHGPAAIEHAAPLVDADDVASRLKSLAAKQTAFGYALAGNPDAARRALDLAAIYMDADDDRNHLTSVGQTSLAPDTVLPMYAATCDVYLGGGASVVETLTPHLGSIASASSRSGAINTAKLATAYANAGEPGRAVELG